MYASRTHYSSLYSPSYMGKQQGVASFAEGVVHRIAAIAGALGAGGLVEMGAGSGRLAQEAEALGCKVAAFDFAPTDPERTRPFDLSVHDEAQLRAALQAIADKGLQQWLLTCLDVLEHIDIEEMAAALLNLNALCRDYSLLSISSRPSSDSNRYHATVLPRPTWLALLKMSGFEVVDPAALVATVRYGDQPDASNPSHWLVRYWRDADLFGDLALGEPWYVLVRKRSGIEDAAAHARAVAWRLDIAHRAEKRQTADFSGLGRFVLNVHHLQDWLHFRPLLDVLRREQVVVLMRESASLTPIQRQAISGFAGRCGLPVHLYRRADSLPWEEFAGATLLSGSESTITVGHALGQQIVRAAQLHGCRTMLLQHGVWSESFDGTPVAFASETLLAWGEEHHRGLVGGTTNVMGLAAPRGVVEPSRVRVIGGPKFAESLMDGPADVLKTRLNVPIERYAGVAVVGTNLHWPRHRRAEPFLPDLQQTIADNPLWYFLVKAHPHNSFYDYQEIVQDNAGVYDDVLSIMTDVATPRFMRGADVLLSSLSTLLLDAAILKKPVLQYETGIDLGYQGIAPAPLSAISTALGQNETGEARAAGDRLVAHYAEADHRRFFAAFAETLKADTRENADAVRSRALEDAGLLRLLETAWLQGEVGSLSLLDLQTLGGSGLFDADFYLRTSGASLPADTSAAEHFLRQGWRGGLDPRPSFDSAWYSVRYLRGTHDEIVAVLHYLREGARLRHAPNRFFDPAWYLHQEPQFDIPGETPLAHYLRRGEADGLTPHRLFDSRWYRAVNPDLAEYRGNLYEHFLERGFKEGRDPHPSFRAPDYVRWNPDLAGSAMNPIMHYLKHGAREGRTRSSVQRLNRVGGRD